MIEHSSVFCFFAISMVVFLALIQEKKHDPARYQRSIINLIFSPLLVLLIYDISINGSGVIQDKLSDIYDYGFRIFFWGITSATDRMANDGYIERAGNVKGFIVVGFLSACYFYYRFISTSLSFDGADLDGRQAVYENGANVYIGSVMALMLFGAIFIDQYPREGDVCWKNCPSLHITYFPGGYAIFIAISIVVLLLFTRVRSFVLSKMKEKRDMICKGE